MGCASFTAFIVAMVQTPSDGALQPIENSPPGIHTMPSGAFLGAGVCLGIVGTKSVPPMVGAPSSAGPAGDSHAGMLGFSSCACKGPPAPMSAAVAVSKDRL